jgi:uncharacterized membrane-anchored protein
MSVTRWAWLLLLPLNPVSGQRADTAAPPPDPGQLEARFHYQTGRIVIGSGLATLELPRTFRYLDPKETDVVLTTWGNPPGTTTLGMLVPAGTSVFAPESWAVVIQYDEDGHVDDADAASINYPKLLKDMQRQTRDENAERTKAGYPPVELVDWAEPPRYDLVSHKLFWAKDLRFGSENGHTLNYNIRVLGRRGVLVLNAVATMDQLQPVKGGMATVIGFVDFNAGNRYADFVAGSDKVAEYGIAALVAGGIAAKAGFFKLLLAGILALKKVLIVAVVAVGAWLKRLFGRRSAEAPRPPVSRPG